MVRIDEIEITTMMTDGKRDKDLSDLKAGMEKIQITGYTEHKYFRPKWAHSYIKAMHQPAAS